jgi:hypothetical protein
MSILEKGKEVWMMKEQYYEFYFLVEEYEPYYDQYMVNIVCIDGQYYVKVDYSEYQAEQGHEKFSVAEK